MTIQRVIFIKRGQNENQRNANRFQTRRLLFAEAVYNKFQMGSDRRSSVTRLKFFTRSNGSHVSFDRSRIDLVDGSHFDAFVMKFSAFGFIQKRVADMGAAKFEGLDREHQRDDSSFAIL